MIRFLLKSYIKEFCEGEYLFLINRVIYWKIFDVMESKVIGEMSIQRTEDYSLRISNIQSLKFENTNFRLIKQKPIYN